MGVKLIRDPEALQAELQAANARNRELSASINSISKERKEHQRTAARASEAAAAKTAAEASLEIANQRIASLEQALESERSQRAAEQRQVAAARSLKRAFEAL